MVQYGVGEIGRVFVARIDEGEDVEESIKSIVSKEGVKGGVLMLIGATMNTEIITPKREATTSDPKPQAVHTIDPALEVVAVGTIATDEGKPSIHIHCGFGQDGPCGYVGHLVGAQSFVVVEAIILEITGLSMQKEKETSNPERGFKVLSIDPSVEIQKKA